MNEIKLHAEFPILSERIKKIQKKDGGMILSDKNIDGLVKDFAKDMDNSIIKELFELGWLNNNKEK
jgi:hypothetical protein